MLFLCSAACIRQRGLVANLLLSLLLIVTCIPSIYNHKPETNNFSGANYLAILWLKVYGTCNVISNDKRVIIIIIIIIIIITLNCVK
jgi:hypothetical protein